MFVLTFFTDTSHLRLSYLHETWIQCEQATATSDTVWQILREDEEGRKEVHRERLEPMGGSSGGGVEGGGCCGMLVQYVADPWHTRQLYFPRCSLS